MVTPLRIYPKTDEIQPIEPTIINIINTDDPTYNITGHVNEEKAMVEFQSDWFPLYHPLPAATTTEIKNIKGKYITLKFSLGSVEAMSIHDNKSISKEWAWMAEKLQELWCKLYPEMKYPATYYSDLQQSLLLKKFWKKYLQMEHQFRNHRLSPSI